MARRMDVGTPQKGGAMNRPTNKLQLFELGCQRVYNFCDLNKLVRPAINEVKKEDWVVGSCAYYRPDTKSMRKWTRPGINICLDRCGRSCNNLDTRNWSWPGSTTDRTVYGVLCHELGHHVDWLTGKRKGKYFSEYCQQVKDEAKEEGITSYANENSAEWFAEAFRLFVTNPELLMLIRPRTYGILCLKFKPIKEDWKEVLGSNVPSKILAALRKKMK